MHDTQSRTESFLDMIKGIDSRTIMLPEFQRDFRWEPDRTYDLFDSLVKEIFIGTIIYGKPSFGMTWRAIDTRPRKRKGSQAKLVTHAIGAECSSAGALTPATLKALRAGYAEQATPVQQRAGEALALERRLAALVNAAYGLTPEDVDLLWRTAPPRMPVGRERY